MSSHVSETIKTYDRIAKDYGITAVPELRAWHEESMRKFQSYLKSERILVAACGDGRDSRFLKSLGLSVFSFDLSEGMLNEARRHDPQGEYISMDLRSITQLKEKFGGIVATGCLYHLSESEFERCISDIASILMRDGVFYLSMKTGSGAETKSTPGKGYPGGEEAKDKLSGPRFYQYYSPEQLIAFLKPEFDVLDWRNKEAQKEGVVEFWVRKR